jgi:hypothetical protein
VQRSCLCPPQWKTWKIGSLFCLSSSFRFPFALPPPSLPSFQPTLTLCIPQLSSCPSFNYSFYSCAHSSFSPFFPHSVLSPALSFAQSFISSAVSLLGPSVIALLSLSHLLFSPPSLNHSFVYPFLIQTVLS